MQKNELVVTFFEGFYLLSWANDGLPFMRLRPDQIDETFPELIRGGMKLIRRDLGVPLNPIAPETVAANALAYAIDLIAKASGLDYTTAKACVLDAAVKATADRSASEALAEDIHQEIRELV